MMTNHPFVLWILKPGEGWVIHGRYKQRHEACAEKSKLCWAAKVRYEP